VDVNWGSRDKVNKKQKKSATGKNGGTGGGKKRDHYCCSPPKIEKTNASRKVQSAPL